MTLGQAAFYGVTDRESDIARINERFDAFPLGPQLIALGEVGSRSHGTYIPSHIDDIDYMGIVIPPAHHLIGLGRWEHWCKQWEELDVALYSLTKMVRLLLKSNPNVLGFLWLSEYAYTTPAFDLLHQHRSAFASQRAYSAFIGYASAQLHKMEHWTFKGYMGEKRKALVEQFGYDTKNAAHLVRLLRMGIEFLQTGDLNVMRPDAAELVAIKRGEWTLMEVKAEADRLFADARDALAETDLPEHPDETVADYIVTALHREYLEHA